jgi:hypothetical protein
MSRPDMIEKLMRMEEPKGKEKLSGKDSLMKD